MSQPLAADTAPAAEARQIAFFQLRSPAERLALTFDLIAFTVASARAAIRRAHPQLEPLEQVRLMVAAQFGEGRAAQVQCVPEEEGPMSIPAAMIPVAQTCEELGIPYYITGSIASSAYSLPRTTYDIDIVVAMYMRQLRPFIARIAPVYYIDQSAAEDAIQRVSSFNLTHHATGINIDIFVSEGRPFDQMQFQRAQPHIFPGTDRPVRLASAEDVLLNKLAWYVAGQQVSDVQWRDVQGIIRVQAAALDLHYLRQWAGVLGLGELLEAALQGVRPAGPSEPPQQQRLF
jgi:hypothetical protein